MSLKNSIVVGLRRLSEDIYRETGTRASIEMTIHSQVFDQLALEMDVKIDDVAGGEVRVAGRGDITVKRGTPHRATARKTTGE